MRIILLALMFATSLFAQTTESAEKDLPVLASFVAPAYPRAAKDSGIMGKTTTRITVNRDGVVTEVMTVVAHRVFEAEVLKALKQWRFRPSDHEHTFQVTCVFDLDYSECNGPNPRAATSETHVSAELPTTVHIQTDFPCHVDRSNTNRIR